MIIKSCPFPFSCLSWRPSPMKGFLSWLDALPSLTPILGPLRSGTHSVQGTLRGRVYSIHSSQLNWTYAATYIQFSWVEVRASTQLTSAFQISRLNFCWFTFPGLFFPALFAAIGYGNSPSLQGFLVHLGSNSNPILNLTQGRKISNSTQFVLTQKTGTVWRKSLDFDTTQIVKFKRLE